MRKAICIPTFNRAEAIDELLLRYKEIFEQLEYDIYIYDSSQNSETCDVVNRHKNNSNNIFYISVDSAIHSNMKVFFIYEEFREKDEYEYIWIQSDSIRWSADSLQKITDLVNMNEYDLIIPNYRDVEKIGNRVYWDCNEFFRDCAWHMTLYGATIVKIRTVLNDVDWEGLKKKYGCPNTINFSHVGLYFEQILKMDQMKVYHLSLPEGSLSSSLFKKASGWRGSAFFILCESWPNVINTLPGCYRYKQEVIKKNGVNNGDFTKEGLKRLREEGVLNLSIFSKYKTNWKSFSNVSIVCFCLYSIMPRKISIYFSKQYWADKKIKKELRKFCKGHSDIYIYGSGQKGNAFANFLEEMNISYKGFLISDGQKDKMKLHGKPVITYDKSILKNNTAGIILALNERNCKEVIKQFSKEEIGNNLFCEYT